MRRFATISLTALALSACAAQQQHVPLARAQASAARTPTEAQSAPLAALVSEVNIPYQRFTLANGLTVLVHTDRKAPIVGVTTYYRVGSKNEPRGRTGFAHLFEHLFFGGSENVPNFDVPLEAAGSTPTNGSTWYDRTNYVETVPTGALSLALFMESDRMGHLLGAVTQDKLDKQRGVVQNEKRQGDNQPYGLVRYAQNEGLFPVGHPYRHSTIGSMADLDAASLSDVRAWFTGHYGPNDAVLALSGDIDVATARPLVEKWFGSIPSGPKVENPPAGPVTLPAPVSRTMTDQVPMVRLMRLWSVPGLNDPDALALDLGMRVLGGLASSRLDNQLVRGSEVAVSVSADVEAHEQVSMAEITMDVKPGKDRARAEAAFDKVIADFLAEGPSADEVQRAAMQYAAQQVGALEEVGGFSGKGATLAEGLLYSGDPEKYKHDLAEVATLTPEQVHTAMQRWLGRPVYKLAIVPGERTESGDKLGGWGDEPPGPAPRPDAGAPAPKLATGAKREAPPVAPVGALTFPAIERTSLSNGIPVMLARRTDVPKVEVSLDFDAGTSADSLDTPGTQALMLAALDQGTDTLDATQIAEAQERLGARIDTGEGPDASSVSLDALAPNLAPSLSLMAEIVRRPAFRDGDVTRMRDQQLAGIAQANSSPRALAIRTIGPLLYGSHPYGQPLDGLGNAEAVKALTPAALRAAHAKWLRPDLAAITVVGDVTMEQLKPMLERTFGDWLPPATARPVKNLAAAIPAPRPRIVLIDRPNSPQSVILAGRVLPLTGRDQNQEALELANEVLGNDFLSRLNLDLREDKGWSYGVRSLVPNTQGPRSLLVFAPVQSDRTGDSIRLLLADMKAFPNEKPVDQTELTRVTEGNIRGLPNRYETNEQVLGAIVTDTRLGRPDDYVTTLPDRYRAIDARALDAAAAEYLQPGGLVFVVVGDAKLVSPQLSSLGLPVEVEPAPAG